MALWTTGNEKSFLDRIGTYETGRTVHAYEVTASDKARLLRGYLRGMDRRKNWAGINKAEVRRHAEHLLKKFEGEVR